MKKWPYLGLDCPNRDYWGSFPHITPNFWCFPTLRTAQTHAYGPMLGVRGRWPRRLSHAPTAWDPKMAHFGPQQNCHSSRGMAISRFCHSTRLRSNKINSTNKNNSSLVLTAAHNTHRDDDKQQRDHESGRPESSPRNLRMDHEVHKLRRAKRGNTTYPTFSAKRFKTFGPSAKESNFSNASNFSTLVFKE